MEESAMHRRLNRTALLGILATVVGCFYVNINFPATELEELARRIAHEYYQEPADSDPNSPSAPVPPDGGSPPEPPKTSWISSLLESPVYAAEPALQEKPININASSAAVKKIQASQRERYERLRPLYERGIVGIRSDGGLAVRDVDGASVKEKTDARRLVDAENADRSALYREIAVANDIPASEVPRIQSIFAKKWVEEAPVGYWYQNEKGEWLQVQKKR
jgi:uncharacterized protein